MPRCQVTPVTARCHPEPTASVVVLLCTLGKSLHPTDGPKFPGEPGNLEVLGDGGPWGFPAYNVAARIIFQPRGHRGHSCYQLHSSCILRDARRSVARENQCVTQRCGETDHISKVAACIPLHVSLTRKSTAFTSASPCALSNSVPACQPRS